MPLSYLRDPDRIFRRSMEILDDLVALKTFPAELHPVVRRIVHACGMPEVAEGLRWSAAPNPAEAAVRALRREGAKILCDCEMVERGILRGSLPDGATTHCFLNDPRAQARGKSARTTRAAAATTLWPAHLDGAVVAIGNAPTALFRLLEGLTEENWPPPAVIFAFPVGFVGAAESKAALADARLEGIGFLTLEGRRGGSAMAAAAVNAVLRMAARASETGEAPAYAAAEAP